jgi:divalent metal cation (Fe/Co/Zn/Cd) transporter
MDEHLYDDLIAGTDSFHFKLTDYRYRKVFYSKAGMQYHVDLHAIVDSNNTVKRGHDLAHKLKDTLREQIQNWDMY